MTLEDVRAWRDAMMFYPDVMPYIDFLIAEVERLKSELPAAHIDGFSDGKRFGAARCAEIAENTPEGEFDQYPYGIRTVYGQKSAEAIRNKFRLEE